jgi:hypothetical protein
VYKCRWRAFASTNGMRVINLHPNREPVRFEELAITARWIKQPVPWALHHPTHQAAGHLIRGEVLAQDLRLHG